LASIKIFKLAKDRVVSRAYDNSRDTASKMQLKTSRRRTELKGPSMSIKPRTLIVLVVIFLLVEGGLFFYFTTGFFVIQPTRALPEGGTVWYWRYDTGLPFISSADGFLVDTREGVSLLDRRFVLAALAELIAQLKIASLPYSKTLYLISTGGREFHLSFTSDAVT
jgi:hypothetical protein